MPSWDFEWELVRLYNRDQIDAVVVDGRPVMAGGRPVGWDTDDFVAGHLRRAAEAVAAAPIERRHGTSEAYRERGRRSAVRNVEPIPELMLVGDRQC